MNYSAIWQQAKANPKLFGDLAMSLFVYCKAENRVYNEYVTNIKKQEIRDWREIPCLPVEVFKRRKVVSYTEDAEYVFHSSGTGMTEVSKVHVKSLTAYIEKAKASFEYRYGNIEDYCFISLLPSYMENPNSSLICMMDAFIKMSKFSETQSYFTDYEALISKLNELKTKGQKTVLMGVSYALLDLAERYKLSLEGIIIMETGGMKGRRKEITREELHSQLTGSFGVEEIHSEYGMSELMSQFYSKGYGVFECLPWMRVLVHDFQDPLELVEDGKAGRISVIDLSSVDNCPFIKTSDIGRILGDGRFEVLGRMDGSDIRGCNLLV